MVAKRSHILKQTCSFQHLCVTFLLPPGIKRLKESKRCKFRTKNNQMNEKQECKATANFLLILSVQYFMFEILGIS